MNVRVCVSQYCLLQFSMYVRLQRRYMKYAIRNTENHNLSLAVRLGLDQLMINEKFIYKKVLKQQILTKGWPAKHILVKERSANHFPPKRWVANSSWPKDDRWANPNQRNISETMVNFYTSELQNIAKVDRRSHVGHSIWKWIVLYYFVGHRSLSS